MTAEQAADLSRRHAVAGLIVRTVDLLLSGSADVPRRLYMVAVPSGDVGHVGPLIAASRDWRTLSLPDTSSEAASLRALARTRDADHTGNQEAIRLQIHRALMLRATQAVVIIEGRAALGRCMPSLLMLGAHNRLRLVCVADSNTAGRVRRFPRSFDGFPFTLATAAARDHAAARLLRVGRRLKSRRLDRMT